MPQGRVVDPEGQQEQLTWGYIQRFDGPDRSGKKLWPWKCVRKKLIPFLNNGSFKKGQLVVFEVSSVDLEDPELGVAKLGIATGVRKVNRK